MLDWLLEWDRETLVCLNNLGVEKYDAFWDTVTKYPPWIPLFLVFFLLIYRAFQWRQVIVLLLVLGAMILFVETLTHFTKLWVARVRPNNDEEIRSLIRVLRNPKNYSFFSGHASMSFSVTTFIYLSLRQRFRWTWIFYIWPFLFIVSRIYLGVHFPLDVIAGALVGIFTAWMFHTVYKSFILPYLALNRP